MARMYHPDLGRETDVPDDDGCIAVHAEAGWELAPEPEARPGYEPEPVRYEPVVTDTKPTTKAKTGTKTDKTDDD